MQPALLSVDELTCLLAKEFPEAFNDASGLAIEAVWSGGCRMRQAFRHGALRPGGTLSGPSMMALADVAMYVGILASIGWKPLAVTTNLNVNFLRLPAPADLIAECRLLKLGKRLAVGDVSIFSEGQEGVVAHATSTYSLPVR